MRLVLPLITLVSIAILPVSAHGQKANVDACSLLTASEASKAIGVNVDKGHHLLEPHKDQCWWSDDDTANPDHRRVTLTIEAPFMFARMKSVPNVTTEPVSGVGDEAYYVFSKGLGTILAVRKGSVAFQLKVLNGSKVKPALALDEVKARELVLAKAAVGRA
jgi:hypothetical protein